MIAHKREVRNGASNDTNAEEVKRFFNGVCQKNGHITDSTDSDEVLGAVRERKREID